MFEETLYVMARDADEARSIAMDGVSIYSAEVSVCGVKAGDDVPRDWAHETPFGRGHNNETVAQIMAKMTETGNRNDPNP